MTLAFTYYDIFDSESYKNHIYLYHEESKSKALDDIHICVIELSKYLKLKNNNKIEVDDWAELLNAKTDDAFEDIKSRGGIMAEAVRKLNFFTQDEIDRYWEDMYLKAELDENTLKEYWKEQGLAEGRAEGIEKGRAEGRAEGRVEGLAEGKKEGKKEGREEGREEGRVIGEIRGLLMADVPNAKIIELTGATEEEILEIKNNM